MDSLELLGLFGCVPLPLLDAMEHGVPYASALPYANYLVLVADIAEAEILRQFNPLEDIVL